MNKIFAFSLILLALGLGACDKKEQAAAPAEAPAVTQMAPAADVAEPTADSTVEPVAETAEPVSGNAAEPAAAPETDR
ncbi:MAG: hypothetical protein OEY89_14435 [Gammaproteobacteria bacterium]|nr:hypothetical protein [Gammaproteobacteria bacterium]